MYCDLSRLVPVIYKAFLMMCDVLLSVVLLCCNTRIFARDFAILLAHVLEKLRPDVERVHYCRWLQTKKYNSAGVSAETLENSVIVAAVGRVLRQDHSCSGELYQPGSVPNLFVREQHHVPWMSERLLATVGENNYRENDQKSFHLQTIWYGHGQQQT